MLERLRQRSLQEPNPDLVEEEGVSPLARLRPSALGLTPQQTAILAGLLFLDVMFLACVCLVATSRICLPGICP